MPEGLSAAAGMKNSGRSTKHVLAVWSSVVLASAQTAVLGYVFLADASANIIAGMRAFAAGAVLVMLASTMMPEAYEEGGEWVGMVMAVGFLPAFGLSQLE